MTYRPYADADRESVIALLARDKAPRYATEKSAMFDWQFHDNPFAGPADDGDASMDAAPFLVGIVADELVATSGFIPVQVRCGGRPEAACWSVDLHVASEHRGIGIGNGLMRRVSQHAPIMLGFGISDLSDPILEAHGWRLDPFLENFYFHSREPGAVGMVKNLRTLAVRLLGARPRGGSPTVAREPAPTAGALDALWRRVEPQYPSAVVRDAAYLHWRYRDAPHLRYRWLTARHDGELAGLLLVRHHEIESIVADYLGPLDDPELLSSLCVGAVAELVADGTRRVRCETTSPPIKAALATAGFVPSRWKGRLRVRCNLPDPAAAEEATRGWFVMTCDSDNQLLVL